MLEKPRLHAMIATANAARAKAFYADVLGLDFASEDAFALIWRVGGEELRMNKVPAVTPPAYAILGFKVDDMVKNVRALAAKGLQMERFPFLPPDADGIWTAPDGTKVAWFRDPDGNLLSLVQDA